jgi:hypothetical protein
MVLEKNKYCAIFNATTAFAFSRVFAHPMYGTDSIGGTTDMPVDGHKYPCSYKSDCPAGILPSSGEVNMITGAAQPANFKTKCKPVGTYYAGTEFAQDSVR